MIPDTPAALLAAIDSEEESPGPAEYRLRQAVERLDSLAETRRLLEGTRARFEVEADHLRRCLIASELPEEFAAAEAEHIAAVENLRRLDTGLRHLSGLRVRCLRSVALWADRAASEAEADALAV